MNLRRKVTLIMLIVMMLNLVMLLCFYNLVLSDSIDAKIETIALEIEEKLDEISIQITDSKQISSILASTSQKEVSYKMNIQDEEGHVVFATHLDIGAMIGVHSSRLIQINDETYIINLTAALSVNDATMIPPVQLILKFEYVLILIIAALLSTMLYWFIVKPIESLEVDIDNYQHGIKPQKTVRKDEIGRLQNRFFTLVEALDSQKSQQNRMIASISHDIKTPLTSIIGYAQRLKRGEVSKERQHQYIDVIYEKSIVIKEIVDEFDDYLNDYLMSSLNKKPMLVSELVQLLKSDYFSELDELNILFSVLMIGEDAELLLDISKIRRVFGNIIDNSVKQIQQQPMKKIMIQLVTSERYVLFKIADNGPGIESSLLESIFEPFYTSDQSRKVAGLGLTICRNIIEAHQGEIWAENDSIGGLVILIKLYR